MKTIAHFRWWIVGLIALVTAINYLDRQNLPVALSEIRKTIPISDSQYGLINSLFLFAYGTMYAVGGYLLDRLGSRKGYALMTLWWSLANMLHGLVSSLTGLGIARFLLGVGEGGGFPASAKVVSEWFPTRERSLAFGLFNTGSSVGAVVAPPLIALIISVLDWRWTFLLSGGIGIVWALVWLRIYTVPARSRLITEAERVYLASTVPVSADPKPAIRWVDLFRYRAVWGVMLVKFFPDAGWYFFIFWLPKYLNDVRGLDIKGVGTYGWIPYALAGLGSLASGWLSSFLIRRNLSVDLARKIPLGIAAALLPVSLLITDASLTLAILFFGLAMFGHQAFSTIVQTLVADLFPSQLVGSVSGLMGLAATYGAMLFSLVIGFVIEQYGYGPAFFISGLLHPLGYLLLFVVIKKIEPVTLLPITQQPIPNSLSA
ncbi:MFS transporter [Larkinella sp. VNQ87]|uniref:MFS transporter n=1 Tax=Larkinella sp. VNQ87 TaxID=3400921 RepID=UPI003C0DD98E